MDGHKKIMFAKCVNQFMIRLNNKLIETLKKNCKNHMVNGQMTVFIGLDGTLHNV